MSQFTLQVSDFTGRHYIRPLIYIFCTDTLDKFLDKSKHLGPVDMSTVKVVPRADDPEEEARQQRMKHMPPLEQFYNLTDFEVEPRLALAYSKDG